MIVDDVLVSGPVAARFGEVLKQLVRAEACRRALSVWVRVHVDADDERRARRWGLTCWSVAEDGSQQGNVAALVASATD